MSDNSEVWVYPAGSASDSSLPLDDDDTLGDAAIKGIASGVADSLLDSVFIPGGPYRYVHVSADGKVISWETKSFK